MTDRSKTEKPGALIDAGLFRIRKTCLVNVLLGTLDVLGFEAAVGLFDLKLDGFALTQLFIVTESFYGGPMDEYVLLAVILVDEAIPFVCAKPLDFACRHLCYLVAVGEDGPTQRKKLPAERFTTRLPFYRELDAVQNRYDRCCNAFYW